MRIFFRIFGCMLVLAALVGLAMQQPTAAEDLARGQAAQANYDWARALYWYAQAAASRADDAAPFAASTQLRLWQGRADRAARDWQRAIAEAPHSAAIWWLGGEIAAAQGDRAAALADDQRAIACAPASLVAGEAAEALVRLALDVGDPTQAVAAAQAIPRPSPALRALVAVAWLHLGASAAAQGQLVDGAVARALTPDLLVLIAGWQGTARDEAALGYADLAAGWPRLALTPLRAALAQQPNYGAGQAYLAWALWAVGDVGNARAALAAAERLTPAAPVVVGLMAQLRAAAGDPAGALAALLAWEGRHVATAALWQIQAQLAEQVGQWASAEDALWQLANAADTTDHAAALMQLAGFYVQTGLGQDDGRARWAVFAAVGANPASAAAQDLLGQWAWQQRQPAIASAAHAAALQRDPGYAPAYVHLANEAWQMGDGATARRDAARAVALDARVAPTLVSPLLAGVVDDSLAV